MEHEPFYYHPLYFSSLLEHHRFLRVTTSCDCGGEGMCRANRVIDVEDLICDFLLSRCPPGLRGLAFKGPDPKRRMIRRYC